MLRLTLPYVLKSDKWTELVSGFVWSCKQGVSGKEKLPFNRRKP